MRSTTRPPARDTEGPDMPARIRTPASPMTATPHRRCCVFAALTLLFLLPAAVLHAQDTGRVSPVGAPIPLPDGPPLPPDKLRDANPNYVLPMTGEWRFRLTHGSIQNGAFVQRSEQITASSEQGGNPATGAFDGNPSTRWCASSAAFPQWLQADLGQPEQIAGIEIAWEESTGHYRCKIEGSADGAAWTTLADKSDGDGIGDGPVALAPANAGAAATFRYVRVTVLGVTNGHWASIRECRIVVSRGGKTVVWQPSAPAPDISTDPAFVLRNFSDANWDRLAVPSNWEMAGYSIPTYNSVDDTVGLYRRYLTVPSNFANKRIYWRFDGVLDGAEIYVNGKRAGYHESGYTAFDVDVTNLVWPGEQNLFAVRVTKSTPSVDCDTGDFQTMGGIYRDNYLIAVPSTHVADITVRTGLDAAYHDATLHADVKIDGKPGEAVDLDGQLTTAAGVPVPADGLSGTATIGPDGQATVSLQAAVKAPKLWSAEKPDLYYLVLTIGGPSGGARHERVEQRFGFRTVSIQNGVLLWNGVPIKCAGVCRHDFWADKGFALGEANWRQDLALMKAANINAIRTSHYNHAQRFLELCEEQGFYVLDEVPFCWIGDQIKDPAYLPYLIQRADETLARDKNRPCVLAWSIGNENPPGQDGQAVLDRVHALDPTRPAYVSQMNAGVYKGQDIHDSHYPTPADLVGMVNPTEPPTPIIISENPHIFWQKEAHDYDPGVSDLWGDALNAEWTLIQPEPTIVGSFIWEWQNQGIADRNPDTTTDFYYGPDRLRDENNKGVVDSYRKPKPEWWYVRMVYSPIVIATRTVDPANGKCLIPLTNRYSFTDLKELTCRWTAKSGDHTLFTSSSHVACPPGKSIYAVLPVPSGTTSLRLDFYRPDGTAVIGASLPVRGAVATPAPPTGPAAGGSLIVTDAPDSVQVGNAVGSVTFDRATGQIRSWRVAGRDRVVGGPVLNLGEARPAGGGRRASSYLYGPEPPVLDGVRVAVLRRGDAVQVTTTGTAYTGGTDHAKLGGLVTTVTVRPDVSLDVRWALYWSGPAEIRRLWETGLKLAVPPADVRMRWLRDAPFADYPAGHPGAASGACVATDTTFHASKRDVRWLSLTDAAGIGVVLEPVDGAPLIGRALADATGGGGPSQLFASSAVAGPQDFSTSYIADREIDLNVGVPVGGHFVLLATSGGTAHR